MGVDFAIDVEPRQPTPIEITDDDLEAYYRTNVPAGGPPLVEIREHVLRAIALERAADTPDAIEAMHASFVDRFGRDRIWWDRELEAAAVQLGVTPLSRFQVQASIAVDLDADQDEPDEERRMLAHLQRRRDQPLAAQSWCDPGDGLKTVRALRQHLASLPECAEQRECLGLVEDILAIAEREHRRWRLLVLW
jgi:hypothetical protein